MLRACRASSIFILLFVLGACEKEPAPGQNPPEPPEVFIITATEQPYHPEQGFNARIQSKSDVNISAEVTGKVNAIHFREGDQVALGTPLFDIDPAPYKAALARAKAELAKAKANRTSAIRNFDRGKKLVDDGYISASEYDDLESRKLESIAAVEAAQASLESAQVDLDYTSIKAPQDGRVGRAHVSVGDVVGPNSGTLTTLVGQNDMEAVFQVPEKLLLAAQRPESRVPIDEIEVVVQFSNGDEYPQHGKISYVSNRVDPTTGTAEVRAGIPNPNDLLRPGLYVKALLRLTHPLQGLMIPQAAVQVDQRGSYVLTVDDTNTVNRSNVVTGDRIGEKVLVNSGLQAGERVVIRGVQKARPGTQVTVSEFKPATPANEGSATQ